MSEDREQNTEVRKHKTKSRKLKRKGRGSTKENDLCI
jgi:hypothetical protein